MPRRHEEIEPGAAVGIAFAESDEGDARVLMRKAEQAADRAREQGRHRFEVFDLEHHHELVERLRLDRALREAFAHDHFELHYQPEYDLRRAGWSGAEALLRWRTDERVVVAGEFIAAIEASELILPLGRWVLRQACRDAAQWPSQGAAPPALRVNVSARQFDQDGLVDDVAAALAGSGLPAQRLCLEITETTLMRDIDRTLSMLLQLKALGVQIAIDDFGTGYSSLVYLKRFPIDMLKIDRSFVQGPAGRRRRCRDRVGGGRPGRSARARGGGRRRGAAGAAACAGGHRRAPHAGLAVCRGDGAGAGPRVVRCRGGVSGRRPSTDTSRCTRARCTAAPACLHCRCTRFGARPGRTRTRRSPLRRNGRVASAWMSPRIVQPRARADAVRSPHTARAPRPAA